MKNFIYILLLFALSMGCLTEINFDDGSEATIISGVITNSQDERSIFVTRSKGIDPEYRLLEAPGVIYKNGELEVELIQQKAGVLSVPPSFKVEAGATYYVEITTQNNQTYQSRPQEVPAKRRTDSLSFEIVQRQIGININGETIDQFFVEVFAHILIPEQEDTLYYKWQVDESWNFISDSATCYLTKNVSETPVVIQTSLGLPKGLLAIQITSEEADIDFFYKHYFNVYLHSIDEELYTYYEKVQRLTENTGTLYDEVPAPIKGNVFLSSGEDEFVAGNIEFSLVDTLRLPIKNEDLEIRLFNVCETDEPCIILPDIVPPCVCRDCRKRPGFGTLKPYYWED